jgi:death-on-curing protein
MKILSRDKILEMHESLINMYGGVHGIKNECLFDSAINTPFITFAGEELYPTILDKISAVTYFIISNHPMNDGNKRLGIALMLVLCIKNNISIDYTQDELIFLGLSIATNKSDKKTIKEWIINHIK